ncbi:MAG: MBL fold metallo-hydrolase [Moraxellaceae bacterium]|nr:MBL fold metallo-hydrolase [Pseudobdellovibrionaceae bacterium]
MKLKISRILHAGYIFQSEKTKIAFDPIFENPFSKNCYAYPEVQFDLAQITQLKLDAVFISHYHDDHCSLESLIHLDLATPIYMYCLFDEMFDLIKKLGFVNVQTLLLNHPIQIGDIKVTPRRALDHDVDCLFQIQSAGLNILNVVDSWIDDDTFEELMAEAPWDMVLWPFQTLQEIEVIAPFKVSEPHEGLPHEWITQLKKLNPRYVVPSSCQFKFESWSWYNQVYFPISYRKFKQEIESVLPQGQVIRLNPSVSIELDTTSLMASAPLDWVKPSGDQDVDYEFHPDRKIPSTSDIAQKFPALNSAQNQIILDYCVSGLLDRFKSLDPPQDDFFHHDWNWKLIIFDHAGKWQNFYYSLNGNTIELLNNEPAKISWATEVPLFKFYAGLIEGESLTSMYVRIETQLEADIMEDPLIRCLFNGNFAGYQKAQLNKIKSVR